MNRVKLKVLPIVLMATLLAVGCAGQQGGTNLNPQPTTKILEQVPIWVENVPKDPNYLFASGTETSRKMSIALDKAKTGARRELAQQMEVHVEGLTKAFDEEIGLGADSELLAAYTQTTSAGIGKPGQNPWAPGSVGGARRGPVRRDQLDRRTGTPEFAIEPASVQR